MDDLSTRLDFLTIVFFKGTLIQKKEKPFKDQFLDQPLNFYYNLTTTDNIYVHLTDNFRIFPDA